MYAKNMISSENVQDIYTAIFLAISYLVSLMVIYILLCM